MKMVFIGFHHRERDPRLFFRERKILLEKIPQIEVYFLRKDSCVKYDDRIENRHLDHSGPIFKPEAGRKFSTRLVNLIWRRINGVRRALNHLRYLRRLKPDVVQASDAREIPFTLLVRIFTGSRIIYDSHEDYFRQVFDYGGRSLFSLLRACPLKVYEVAFLRFFDAVFCTDDFLLERYNRLSYGCKDVQILRNFPSSKSQNTVLQCSEKSELALVYIGSVNAYRGVLECTEYIERFNTDHSPGRALSLTIYGPENDVVRRVKQSAYVRHYGWVDFEDLMSQMKKYDVGVCLWQNIKKFRRNLPLKNFDYMSEGLPILTSNFGNLEKYARLSGAAMCIDPSSYSEFESAIMKLFDPECRRELGQNGMAYVKRQASFEVEAVPYVSFIQTSANRHTSTNCNTKS